MSFHISIALIDLFKPQKYFHTEFTEKVNWRGRPRYMVGNSLPNLGHMCFQTGKLGTTLTRQFYYWQDCSGGGCGAAGGSGCCSAKESINGGPSREDVEKELCYSCRVTVSCIKSMPEFLLKEAGKRTRRRATKEQIQDFLL